MLAPEAQRALVGWEPLNSRIITAKFTTKKKDNRLNIIQCYVPTNDVEEERKEEFNQQLQAMIDRGGVKDMTILMGDFNGIPAEAIKADIETTTSVLHSLFSKIWEKEEVPAQWREGIVIKLPKKGDLRDCNNYRGIMLLSVPGKVLNRIILERALITRRPLTAWIGRYCGSC